MPLGHEMKSIIREEEYDSSFFCFLDDNTILFRVSGSYELLENLIHLAALRDFFI